MSQVKILRQLFKSAKVLHPVTYLLKVEVKTEVVDMFRTHSQYSLRNKITRKRFADEVSEPSDLDNSDIEDISGWGNREHYLTQANLVTVYIQALSKDTSQVIYSHENLC